uniref:Craniofacial development protein 2 n=1 Tax=Cacopsylla melanoneura TaxID=428564 RepID=A0A8D9AY99_9HEMI
MNSTTEGIEIPQVGRSNSESHTGQGPGCLMDSGGDNYSIKIAENPKKKKPSQKLKFATWNVKTLLDSKSATTITTPRRTALIAKELNRYNIDIAAIQETHMKENGQLVETGEGYTYIYSGCKPDEENYYGVAICVKTKLLSDNTVSKPVCVNDRLMHVNITEKGNTTTFICCYAPTLNSPEQQKTKFYEELKNVVNSVPKKEKIIIAGDLNARVGTNCNEWKEAMGKHGIGKENANGSMLLEFCTEMSLRIVNTLFYQKSKYKTTWKHPRSHEWHILDYFIVKARDVKSVLRCRSMRGADCDTDHNMVRCEIKWDVQKFHKTKSTTTKFNLEPLKTPEGRLKFENALKNSYEAKENMELQWTNIKTCFINAANSTLAKKKERQRDWFDENSRQIENILRTKKSALVIKLNNPTKENVTAYKKARAHCQKSMREIKEKWWCNRTIEMQRYMDTNDTYNLYKCIHSVTGPIIKPLNIVESSEGKPLYNKDERLERWAHHFENVYNQFNEVDLAAINMDQEDNIEDMADTIPSEDEINSALLDIKNNKSAGLDNINAEMLKAGEITTTKMFQELLSKIWEEKKLPKDWKEALIVPIFKKGKKSICDNYRGISLLSVAGKVISRIIYNRLTPLMEKILSDTQCGFRKNKSTTDMIFSARQLVEKTMEQKSSLCIAFVDLTKAFDSVSRRMLFKILESVKCPPTTLALLTDMHSETSSSVKIEDQTSPRFEVQTGVRQGCVLAPVLFILYIHYILKIVRTQCKSGITITYRSDSNMFCRRNLKAKT